MPTSHSKPGLRTLLLLWALPLATTIIVLCCSPNFDPTLQRGQHPLGSDFLQEWTGGHIWLSEESELLYNESHFRAVQHNSKLTGFQFDHGSWYPVVYPPFYYMLVSPFSLLPYLVSAKVWVVGLGLISGFLLWGLTRWYEPAARNPILCAIGLVAFGPFVISLTMGHKSILLLLLFAATWLLLRQGKQVTGGLVFGLIAFKPHLILVVAAVMLWKRKWHFVAGCGATVAMLVGLSLLAGPQLCVDYFWQCLQFSSYSQQGGYDFYSSQNIFGAVAVTLDSTGWAYQLTTLALVGAVTGAILVSFRGSLKFDSDRFPLQFSQLIIATILVSPHFFLYDLTIVLLPIALVTFEQLRKSRIDSLSRIQIACCVAVFVAAGSSAAVAEQFHFQPILFVLMASLWITALQLVRGPQPAREPRAISLFANTSQQL